MRVQTERWGVCGRGGWCAARWRDEAGRRAGARTHALGEVRRSGSPPSPPHSRGAAPD